MRTVNWSKRFRSSSGTPQLIDDASKLNRPALLHVLLGLGHPCTAGSSKQCQADKLANEMRKIGQASQHSLGGGAVSMHTMGTHSA